MISFEHIAQRATASREEGWILKQVQDDGEEE